MNSPPAWLYNEFQSVGTNFEADAIVARYDRNQTSTSVESERALVAELGIGAGSQVVDLGCGTGTFAIEAARAGARVDAVDISQTMLRYAQAKAEQVGVEPHIQFHHAGFLTYDRPAASVDVIVTQAALHHLPDFWKMAALLRLTAMLKPGGSFYLWDTVFSFAPAQYHASIPAWIQRVAKPEGEGWTQQDFETHVREEYTTFTWIIEKMFTQAGLEIESQQYFSPEYAEYFCRKPFS